ncbi:hypothetical protein BDW62DRAFT_150435 [Aspergillus aurantiobrunneus]
MHLSNLLFASAMTLAPAVYGYGIAKVEISYHEGCSNGEYPRSSIDSSESTVVTPDTCPQLPAKHSFDIDAYTFQVEPITKDTTSTCHAVSIYTNDQCVGLPLTVIPLFPGKDEAISRCIKDDYFDKDVSLKLVCEDEDKDDHDGSKKHDDDEDDHKKQVPQGKKGFLSGL